MAGLAIGLAANTPGDFAPWIDTPLHDSTGPAIGLAANTPGLGRVYCALAQYNAPFLVFNFAYRVIYRYLAAQT